MVEQRASCLSDLVQSKFEAANLVNMGMENVRCTGGNLMLMKHTSCTYRKFLAACKCNAKVYVKGLHISYLVCVDKRFRDP